ncbi:hypothetical protein, conserved [Eimeria praecox]|uniref:Uncharacterized protein n=1 Tax=Eimeria praecox TaxID=51316 RepID=U6G101_9EIME|nr:hypothetical protein, conserved [Eimeria praecox]
MAQQPQDKLEAAAEAAGAAAAAAAASVWRFFEDDTASRQDSVKNNSGNCENSTNSTNTEQQVDAVVSAGATAAAKLTPSAESTGPECCNMSSSLAGAPVDGSTANLSNSDGSSSSSDSSTTATSKDTSPLGPRGNADEPNALAGHSISSSASNADSEGIADCSTTGSCNGNSERKNGSGGSSSSSNKGDLVTTGSCNGNSERKNGSGGSSSSNNKGDLVSALGMLRNAASRVLSGGSSQQQQQLRQEQQQHLQGATEETHSHDGLLSASRIAPGAAQTVTAAAGPAPGAAAAAAVVAAAVAAAEAALRGGSSSELSSSSNSSSGTAHYQTSTTPEALQVAHRLPPQQKQEDQQRRGKNDQSMVASAANTGLGGAAEPAGSTARVASTAEAAVEATSDVGASTAAAANSAEAAASSGIHKLVETRLGYATDIGGQLQQTAQQTAAKKHPEEDASTPSWYRHKRHTFIFSYSGKPVYSRYGKEENLGAFAGALSAIISKLERFRGDKPPDVVRHFRCFGGRFVFLPRGPFYLALFDRQSINNGIARAYLMLLHRQLVCILTKEVERTLLIRPSFDVRPLMGGTDGIFRGLHRHYFNSMLSVLLPILLESNCAAAAAPAGNGTTAPSPAAEQLHHQQQQQEQQSAALSISGAFEALPLSGTMRHIATTAVKNGPTPNVLASMLLAEQRVVSLSYAKGYELSSTVKSYFEFRHSPEGRAMGVTICACRCLLADKLCEFVFGSAGFLHAYVRYLTPRLAFVCLSSPADSIRFHHLANHCNKLFAMLTNTGCLAAIETSLEYAPYALPRCLWGEIALVHCALFVPSLSQYFSSAFGDDYKTDVSKQQRVYTLYTSAAELIQNAKRPAHSFVETTDEKVYVWLTGEFFFFCCVPRWINVSTTLVEQLAKWIREQQPFLFITETPPLVHTPQQK